MALVDTYAHASLCYTDFVYLRLWCVPGLGHILLIQGDISFICPKNGSWRVKSVMLALCPSGWWTVSWGLCDCTCKFFACMLERTLHLAGCSFGFCFVFHGKDRLIILVSSTDVQDCLCCQTHHYVLFLKRCDFHLSTSSAPAFSDCFFLFLSFSTWPVWLVFTCITDHMFYSNSFQVQMPPKESLHLLPALLKKKPWRKHHICPWNSFLFFFLPKVGTS